MALLSSTPLLRAPHRYAGVQRVMGILLMAFSSAMLPPLMMDVLFQEPVTTPFLVAMGVTLTTGAALWWPVRGLRSDLKIRDGFLITVLFWAGLALFGAIPLYLAPHNWHTATDAIFESVSALTTTGATTVSQGLDTMPHSLLFYRSELQWLGGMGIIVLAVAVLPMLGVGGMGLFKAETPGPMKDAKLTPRITSTARALWLIYVALTLTCGFCFWLAGMSPFDAVCHGMTTVATGGFSTHDASIGYFNSGTIEVIVIVFTMISVCNYALHYTAWHGRRVRSYMRDTEFRVFMMLHLALIALVCVPLVLDNIYPDPWTAIRKGIFTAVAFGTTSGFAVANPTAWPSYVPTLLILSSFMMACAASTGGGVKVVRLVLFVKQAAREMRLLVHPSAEVSIKLDHKVMPNDVVYAVGGFFSVYIGMTLLLTGLMQVSGLDPLTAFSAAAASMNNLGPGLGLVNANVAGVSDFGKWVMVFGMLAGRLEVFTLLVLFTPSFWRR